MPKSGRRLASTPEQREQVLRLVEDGLSRRAVAREVFGDERLHGRVDRIVRGAELSTECSDFGKLLERLGEAPTDKPEANLNRPSLEDLVARYALRLQRRLDDLEDWVSAGELLAFARLNLWLENDRRIEQANRLTRD
jgi:hypothetical protein